jgi:branched-chain amino acid aminotransferase
MPHAELLTFTETPSEARVSPADRTVAMQDPGFGLVFTDHMVTIQFSQDRGWHDARVSPRGPIPLDPAAGVLHYAQEIFEGMKAYRTPDGGAQLFRPDENAKRFQRSAERMEMPTLPVPVFIEAVERLVRIDKAWIPTDDGSLYLRPFMFSSQAFLGAKPASQYQFVVIASPVGSYFKGGAAGVSVWASKTYSRAGFGGTGSAKCGGNYAASMIAQAEAARHGCDQAIFLDAASRQYIEELGGMNVFFVFEDGSLLTPPLNGNILPGVTRASIITLAKDIGLTVREELYSLDQCRADILERKVVEAFACGTAAVVTPIREIKADDWSVTVGAGRVAHLTERLREQLVAIQRGEAPDPHRWTQRLF